MMMMVVMMMVVMMMVVMMMMVMMMVGFHNYGDAASPYRFHLQSDVATPSHCIVIIIIIIIIIIIVIIIIVIIIIIIINIIIINIIIIPLFDFLSKDMMWSKMFIVKGEYKNVILRQIGQI